MSRKPPTSRFPGKREQARIFQIGGQWLDREEEGGNWYRYWYEPGSRRVSRKTLGTRDLEEAKQLLSKIVLSEPAEDPTLPTEVLLAAVFAYYMQGHGKKIRGGKQARRSFTIILEYLKKAVGSNTPMVSDFGLLRQHGFMTYCRNEYDLSVKTISTYLAMAKAALNYAATPRIIRDSKGVEREGQLLSGFPKIFDGESYISDVTGLPMPSARDWIPTDHELATFIDAIDQEHVFRYVISALNTVARPEAITELDVSRQVDFEKGLVDMNPPGRKQNRKVRPLIRLTDNYRGWLLHWNLSRPIEFRGRPVSAVQPKTFKVIATRAGVPKLTRYTLRHYMATRVKRLPTGLRPDREERAAWLGHTDPAYRTTEAWYETHDPDYLVNMAKAIDLVMSELDNLCGKSLVSPNSLPSQGLTVIDNTKKINELSGKKGA